MNSNTKKGFIPVVVVLIVLVVVAIGAFGIVGGKLVSSKKAQDQEVKDQNAKQVEQAGSRLAAKGWKKFEPTGAGFRVMMPNANVEKKEQTQDIPGKKEKLNMVIYASVSSIKEAYLIEAVDYPKGMALGDTDVVLKQMSDGLVSGIPGSSVVSSQKGTFRGYTTGEYVIKGPNGAYFRARLILVGKGRVYVLMEASMDKESLGFADFAQSFEVL